MLTQNQCFQVGEVQQIGEIAERAVQFQCLYRVGPFFRNRLVSILPQHVLSEVGIVDFVVFQFDGLEYNLIGAAADIAFPVKLHRFREVYLFRYHIVEAVDNLLGQIQPPGGSVLFGIGQVCLVHIVFPAKKEEYQTILKEKVSGNDTRESLHHFVVFGVRTPVVGAFQRSVPIFIDSTYRHFIATVFQVRDVVLGCFPVH